METDMQTDAAATAAEIPGLVIRPYGGEADLPEVARIQSAEWAADGVSERASVDELRAWWGNPSELGISRGWLDGVFTRRAWRRRGLARALIVRSLHLLQERGLETAALGVDADNPSGAFGLYESAGFHPTERFVSFRKPMELDR
jgi:ribosomal protein S18 acetylase RimI-like enzyme